MSVPNQTPIVESVANGNTVVFPFNFFVLQSEDLDVYVAGALKTEGTDYSVAGIGNSQGGNVTFTAAAKPLNGQRVILRRQTPVERTTNYTYLGDLQASDLNADFDRLWLSLQEQRATFGSSISRPAGGVGNWDAQGFAISGMADGTQPGDAVTLRQLTIVNGNAADAAARAAASAQAAATSEQNAAGSQSAAATSASGAAGSASTASTKAGEASNSATSAYKWASTPVNTEVTAGNFSALHWATKAQDSAVAAAGSATSADTSAGIATGAATTATGQADRAKTEADKLGNMNALAAAIQSVTGNAVVWKGSQSVLTEGANDQDLVTVRQLRAATAGGSGSAALINGVVNNFIGAVEWWMGSTTTFPAGFLPASGQVLNRADYPELWAAINASLFPSSTETVWQATPTARGVFSTGDGSTTFRMPDLNGVQTNSIAALFLRGSAQGDPNSGGLNVIRENAVPNITAGVDGNVDFGSPVAPVATNAFTTGNVANATMSSAGSGASAHALSFNASRANAAYGRNAATEVRPNSIKGTWIMRVNGSFTAASTNFSVLNGAATAPANGAVVYGGDLLSKYQVAGADYAAARLRAKVTGGSTPVKQAAIGLQDGQTSKEWLLPDTAGTLALRSAANTFTGPQTFSANSVRVAGITDGATAFISDASNATATTNTLAAAFSAPTQYMVLDSFRPSSGDLTPQARMISYNGNAFTALFVKAGAGSSDTYGGAFAYSGSDSVLKDREGDVDYAAAVERVKALRPCEFTWKRDGRKDRGFIAQEARNADERYAYAADPYWGLSDRAILADLTKLVQKML